MGSSETSPKSYNDWPNHQGFNSSYEERTPVELKVSGDIPSWAAGVLYRTGTGRSEIETDSKKIYKVAHWFDGMAVVHRFQILQPDAEHSSVRVIYNSRSTCDGQIEQIRKTGRGKVMSFGAKYDPCTSYFKKVMSLFQPAPARDTTTPDMQSIAITLSVNFPGIDRTAKEKTSGHASGIQTLTNKTDAAVFQTIDPETLEPIGVASQTVLHPDLKGPISAAHAKADPVTGDVYNFNLDLGRTPVYRVFTVSASTGQTSILATIDSARASYLHSFFLTKNYVILCIWNSFFAAGGAKILWHRNIVDAIENYDGSKPATWYVIDRRPADKGGKGLVATYESDPFFCFHTINAYEEPSPSGNGTDIVADIVTYPNLDVLKRFYLPNIISTSPTASEYCSKINNNDRNRYKRFRLPTIPSTPSPKAKPQRATCEFTIDYKDAPELPTLNPGYITKPHRYVYGVTDTGKSSFLDGIVKIDTVTKKAVHWNYQGQNAGEPIFVPRKLAAGEEGQLDEDDGVLLSVVLDGFTGTSYLLVLDAKSMTEVGRAEVNGAIGFGFHGTHVPAVPVGKAAAVDF
ncbi:hypothetical protein FQN55_002742 [Onygenales sp. PD_40]|nr:hypothetical protein FQN55_002742 [Onygenales sp. PD_40]